VEEQMTRRYFKPIIIIVACFSLLTLLIGCSANGQVVVPTAEGTEEPPTAQAPIRVLFIGNSYTYVNDLPETLESLSANEARPVEAASVSQGLATLDVLWKKGDAVKEIQKGNWDFVVLQEQSQLGTTDVKNGLAVIKDPSSFFSSVRL